MKKYLITGLTILSLIFLFSCKVNGPAGAEGEPGADTVTVEFQYGVLPSTGYLSTETKDSFIVDVASTSNFGSEDFLGVGLDTAAVLRTLLKFDLSGIIPSNVIVTSAYLTVYAGDGAGSIATVYQLTKGWSEGTGTVSAPDVGADVSWNSFNSTGNNWTTPGGDFYPEAKSNTVVIDDYDYFSFNLNAAMVQGWINNSSSNYGMIIIDETESGAFHHIEFASKEGPAGFAPKLTVSYQVP